MTDHRRATQAYFDGFARSDHAAILDLLTDDVVWVVHGQRELRGKPDFDGEIENDAFDGAPQLDVREILVDGDSVAVPHTGRVRTREGETFVFAACDVLTFEGDLIARVESYVVPLTDPS